jgi:Skp family chaperone for outer membrane proteins
VSIRPLLSLSLLAFFGHQGVASAQTTQGNEAQAPASQVASAFPEGAHYAYLDLNRVVSLTADGRAAAAKIQEFRTQKAVELQGRSKELETLQSKLSSQLLNEAAKTELQRQFDRARVDFQRLSQDANAAIQEMQDQAEKAFFNRLFPVVGQIAKEKSLWAVFTADSPIVWHDEKIDISEEVAKRLDAVPASPKPPAAQ